MAERLPRQLPGSLTDEQLAVHAKFAGGRRADPANGFSLVHADGGLVGPPNIWLLSPPLADALERLGGAVRFELELTPRAHELAILLVGVSRRSDFELATHVPAARSAGLSEAQIEAVLAGRPPDQLTETEQLVHDIVSTLVRDHELDDALYARGAGALGTRGIFELVTLVGYYELVAMQLEVFGAGQGSIGDQD